MFTSTYCSSLIAVHRSPLIVAYRSPLIAIRRSPFFVRRLPFAPHRLPPFTVHCPSPSRHIVNKCVLCVLLSGVYFIVASICCSLLIAVHSSPIIAVYRSPLIAIRLSPLFVRRLPSALQCSSPFIVQRRSVRSHSLHTKFDI